MITPATDEPAIPLRVRDVSLIAADIFRFEFVDPSGAELPAFTAGAHLHVRVPNGATRRYSLCNAPQERDRYVIAVKRESNGRGGSASLIDGSRAGDELLVSTPRNDFELRKNAASYVFIAGGIGITPIRSMMQDLLHIGTKPFKLYYLCRAPEMTAFLDEFTEPAMRSKVVIHHDYGDSERAYDLWPILERPKGSHLYCCGPRPLMEAVRDMTGHWSTSAVHFEDFGSGQVAHKTDDRAFKVRVGASGEAIDVLPGTSILEALRAHGHRVSSSCESGTCGTCRVRLLAGEPDHRDLVLSDAERLREIMVCVSRAHSPELVIELAS